MPISVFDLDEAPQRTDVRDVADESLRRNEGGQAARTAVASSAEAAAADKRETTPFRELIGAAAVQGGIGFFDRSYQENSVMDRATPDYELPKDWRERAEAAGVRPEQFELLARATSDEHLELLQSFAFQNQEVQDTQAQFGIAANLVAGFSDPVAFALDAATGGLARAATAGRLANAARSGTVAALSNAALTAGTAEFNPEVGTEEVLISAAAGLALGGALGARRGEEWIDGRKIEDLVTRDITGARESMGAARLDGLIEDETPGIPRRDPAAAVQEQVDRGVDEASVRPAFAKVRLSLSSRLGNMKAPTVRAVSRWLFRDGVGYTDRKLAVKESAGERAALNRARFETELHRGYNAAWVDEREAVGISRWDRGAELEWGTQIANGLRGMEVTSPAAKAATARLRKVLDDAFDLGVRTGVLDRGTKNANYFPQIQSRQAYTKIFGEMGLTEDQGVDIYKQAILADMRANSNPDAVAKFSDIEESYKGTTTAAIEARKTAEARKEDFGAMQQRVRDADEDIAQAQQLTTGRRRDISVRAAERRRDTALRQLSKSDERFKVASAKLKASLDAEDKARFATKQAKALADDGGVDEELAELYAKAIINRGKNQVHGDGRDMVGSLDTQSLDDLKAALEEAGASPAKIASILSKYETRIGEESKLGNAKSRIRLDPSFRTTVKNVRGEDVEIGVTDFMDNDVSRVVTAYTRDIAGWSALAEKGNIRNPTELRALRRQIESEARAAGDNVDDTLRIFDVGVNSALGRTTEVNPHSTMSRWSRALRDTQFLRVMNQVGFTLFTELGPTVAYGGLRNTLESIGMIGDFMRRGRDGTLKSGTARYIEDLISTGTEHLRNPAYLRLQDDAFMPPVYGNNAFGRGLENLTNQAQRLTSVMSGMAPMNTMLQRIAGRATLKKLLQLSNDTRPLGKGMEQRLRNWGLDDETRDALFASLRGVTKVDDIVDHAMSLEARERMAAFMFRVTRQQVIEGDASDSILLMHSSGGKLVTQFRSFMAYSYERHLLNAAYNWRDWQTYQMIALSTSLAGLQWAARTYINTAGDDEKRRKMMTRGNFVKNAVAQSSWGSIIPALTDTILPLAGQDPVFAGNRSSGLSNNLIGGIPAVDFLTKAAAAATLPAQALMEDKEITRRELEQASKLFWFQNLTGWQNIQREGFDYAEESGLLPETSEVEKQARSATKETDKDSWSAKTLFDL